MEECSYDYNNFNFDEYPSEFLNNKYTFDKFYTNILKEPNLKIYAVTWNLYGKKSDIKSIEKLIPKEKNFDIFAIGSEECMRSIFRSFFYSNKSEWEEMLISHIGDNYTILKSENLSAIHLILIVHKKLLSSIVYTSSNNIKTGFYNIIGNKGAVAIWFKYKQKSFIFINCHLTSGQNNSNRRNNDFHRINNLLNIFNKNLFEFQEGTITDQFDVAIFMGDLNYRINSCIEYINICLYKNDLNNLIKYDQMKNEIYENRLNINNFKEADIIFPPTYKYLTDTCIYDENIPGWTDRILYKSKKEIDIVVETYSSLSDICISDHKPVYCIFDLYINNNENIESIDKKNIHVENSKVCNIF